MGKQKLSENTHQHFELVSPKFEWYRNCKFGAEEKIDSANIIIEVSTKFDSNDSLNEVKSITWDLSYKDKPYLVIMPSKLEKHFKETFIEDKILSSLGLSKEIKIYNDDGTLSQEVLDKNRVKTSSNSELVFDINKVPNKFVLYGEGYGVYVNC